MTCKECGGESEFKLGQEDYCEKCFLEKFARVEFKDPDRYILKQGRFGAYFYDTRENRDVDLNEALGLMNKCDELKITYSCDLNVSKLT